MTDEPFGCDCCGLVGAAPTSPHLVDRKGTACLVCDDCAAMPQQIAAMPEWYFEYAEATSVDDGPPLTPDYDTRHLDAPDELVSPAKGKAKRITASTYFCQWCAGGVCGKCGSDACACRQAEHWPDVPLGRAMLVSQLPDMAAGIRKGEQDELVGRMYGARR